MFDVFLWTGMFLTPAALGGGTDAPITPSPMIWERSFNPAFKAARDNEHPVMIVHLVKGDAANEGHLNLYDHPDVQAICRSLVCLIADPCRHDEFEGEGEHAGRKVCSIHRTLTCMEHQEVDRAVKVAFFPEEDAERLSVCLFITPEGDVISRDPLPASAGAFIHLAERALQAVNPGEKMRALKRLTENRIARFREPIFQAQSPEYRRAALKRLAITGDVAAVMALYEESGSEAVRIEFLRCAAAPGRASLVPWLKQVLGASSEMLRNHAAVSLEIIGAPAAVPVLMEALGKEKDPSTKKNLVRALGECGPEEPKVQDALKKCLACRDALVRKNAYLALYRMKGIEAIRQKVVTSGLRDKDGDVRTCAAWTLGWIGKEEDIQVLEHLIDKERHRNERFVHIATGAIQKLKGKEYRAFLEAKGDLGEDQIPRDGRWPRTGKGLKAPASGEKSPFPF